MTSQIFTQTCERLAAGCLFGVCKLVNVTFFLTTFSRADEISSSMSRRKPGNYLIDRQMLGWKCKELENNGDFVVHWPCLQMSLCRRKICLNDKKQVIFSFLCWKNKITDVRFDYQLKSPKTTLELRIGSFLSNLRSSVLGGSVKVGGWGKG